MSSETEYQSLEEVQQHLKALKSALLEDNLSSVLDILEWFASVKLSAEILAASRAPLVLQKLRKHQETSKKIKQKCMTVLSKWRQIVKAEIGSRAKIEHDSVHEEIRELQKTSPRDALLKRLESTKVVSNNVYDVVEYEYDDTTGFNRNRVRALQKGDRNMQGPVLYWMQRDIRLMDNWALIFAQRRAASKGKSLAVVYCLPTTTNELTSRHYGFLIRGLRQVEADLAAFGIPFRVLVGEPGIEIARYATAIQASTITTDFSPLREPTEWKRQAVELVADEVVVEEVDAHNIVPAWIASNQAEVSARTMRKKLHKLVNEYVTDFPHIIPHPTSFDASTEQNVQYMQLLDTGVVEKPGVVPRISTDDLCTSTNWKLVVQCLQINWSIPEIVFAAPGERPAAQALDKFIHERLDDYDLKQFDANKPAARSGLSPYIRFGHISAQRIILEIIRVRQYALSSLFLEKSDDRTEGAQVFADALLVQKELADNFCLYAQDRYDSFTGFMPWAQEAYNLHRDDPREVTFDFDTLENGQTNDPLWNAAQMELIHTGHLHAAVRQYWAKKLVEFTTSPEEALEYCIRLNDKYAIDGACPAGYAGAAWAIGGVHDMGYKERDVYGKVRNLTTKSCENKFHISTYISSHPILPLSTTMNNHSS